MDFQSQLLPFFLKESFWSPKISPDNGPRLLLTMTSPQGQKSLKSKCKVV